MVFIIFCCLLVVGSTLLLGFGVQHYIPEARLKSKGHGKIRPHAVPAGETIYAPPNRDLMHLWHESAKSVWQKWKPNGVVRMWTHDMTAELFRLRFPYHHFIAMDKQLSDETMKMLGALAVSHTHGGWVSYAGAPPPPTPTSPNNSSSSSPTSVIVDWPCRHPMRTAPAQVVVDGSLWYAPAYHPWVIDAINCIVHNTCSSPHKAFSETMYLASGGLRPRVGLFATWEETMRRKQEGLVIHENRIE